MKEVQPTFKDKYYSFMNKVALEGGSWRNIYVVGIILVGLVIGFFITNWSGVVISDPSTWTEIGFFITAYCLGVPCVVFLANREGTLGNILGILSNIGEMLIFWYFGTMGMVFAGAYFGLTHLIGLVRWNDAKFKDESGKVKIGTMKKEQTIFTGIFIVIGLILLVFFGGVFGFVQGAGTLGLLIWLGNLLTFVISVTAQFLMIIGLKESWTFWFSSNFINFFLNLTSGNVWFMARDVLYQVNAWLAMYDWNIRAYYAKIEEGEKDVKVPAGVRVLEWNKKLDKLGVK